MKKFPKEFELISVEGAIGVGKTSFARILGEKLKAKIVLENVEDNPFIKEFYQNPKEYAFITQINFLFIRYEQLKKLFQRDLFYPRIITDFFFWKDRIFACVNLNEKELTLYDKIANLLVKDVPIPDLIIFLQSNSKKLLQNIKKRNYPYEENIAEDYLKLLNEVYNQYFFNYDISPLLIINTDEIDFIMNPDKINDIIKYIENPFQGTKYYSPKNKK
jgi:deoxyadenosine/deoxycytidine kinase